MFELVLDSLGVGRVADFLRDWGSEWDPVDEDESVAGSSVFGGGGVVEDDEPRVILRDVVQHVGVGFSLFTESLDVQLG